MPEQTSPDAVDVEKIKRALVSAGVIKATKLTSEEEANIRSHLEQNGIDARRFPISFKIICHSSHYCIIIKGL